MSATFNVEEVQFPTTRYQGSKRKILPWIAKHLGELSFDTALDAFGGTGSVSYLMKKMGKAVTYNDIMKFNHYTGTALIENDNDKLSEEDVAAITKLGEYDVDTYNFIQKTFRGYYYTQKENKWLDHIVYNFHTYFKDKSKHKEAIAYHALFQSCLVKRPFNLFHRKNLYIRTNDVERNFGNKATWEKDFTEVLKAFINETNDAVFNGKASCKALNFDVKNLPTTAFDLVYFDPPYLNKTTTIETARYERSYHFLEGLSRYKEWNDLIDRETLTRRLKEDQENLWTRKTENKAEIDATIESFKNSIVVFSYKKYGTPSVDTIKRILERHAKKVTVYTKHYKYALNGQNGEAKLNREVLLIGE